MVRTACAQHKAFPQELRPEKYSRVCRVMPLKVYGVFAPKVRRMANAGGTAEESPSSRAGMMGYFFM